MKPDFLSAHPSPLPHQLAEGERSTVVVPHGKLARERGPKYAFNLWCLAAIVVAIWLAGPGGWGWSTATVLYVSPTGSDFDSGSSSDRALRTIQAAARKAGPGCTVRILPGTYRERVHVRSGGKPGQPVVFEAAVPGTVTVSWETGFPGLPLDSGWTNEGDSIYSARLRWPVYHVRDGERTLFRLRWGGLAGLRKLVQRPNAWGAYTMEDRTIYLFRGSQRVPDEPGLVTHQEVPQPREWGEHKSANLWIEADHVQIRGLQFDFGIGAGIRVWNAAHVAISNCAITGATTGVRGGHGKKPARNVTIEQCLYHNYPQWEWQGWLAWEELYGAYPNQSLAAVVDDRTTIRRCVAVHCGDGMHVSTSGKDIEQGILVERNWIGQVTDDGIELDGPAEKVELRQNFIVDCHCALGLSPVTNGPCLVAENFVWLRQRARTTAHLKLLSPWRERDGRRVAIRNVNVERNLFVGGWPSWWSDEVPTEQVSVRENVFAVCEAKTPPFPVGADDRDNVFLSISSEHCATARQVRATMEENEAGKAGWQQLQRFVAECAGPSWWDWNASPITRSLGDVIAEMAANR